MEKVDDKHLGKFYHRPFVYKNSDTTTGRTFKPSGTTYAGYFATATVPQEEELLQRVDQLETNVKALEERLVLMVRFLMAAALS